MCLALHGFYQMLGMRVIIEEDTVAEAAGHTVGFCISTIPTNLSETLRPLVGLRHPALASPAWALEKPRCLSPLRSRGDSLKPLFTRGEPLPKGENRGPCGVSGCA